MVVIFCSLDVQVAASSPFISRLHKKGYGKVVLQTGHGKVPVVEQIGGIDIEQYAFKDSLLPDMACASLIVSHAGNIDNCYCCII